MVYSFPSSNLICSHILLDNLGSLCSPRANEEKLWGSGKKSLYCHQPLEISSGPLSQNSSFWITLKVVGLCFLSYGIYNLEEAFLCYRWGNWSIEKGRDIFWVPGVGGDVKWSLKGFHNVHISDLQTLMWLTGKIFTDWRAALVKTNEFFLQL